MSSDSSLNRGQVPLFDLNQAPHRNEGDTHLFDLNLPPPDSGEYTSHATGAGNPKKSRLKLSSEKRMEILLWLLNRATEGKLARGSVKAAAAQFSVTTRCISKLWNLTKRQKAAGERYNVSTKFHNSGRRRIQVAPQDIAALHMGDRSCIRDLASKLNVSKTTIHRMIKRGTIKPHTNPLHPLLISANRKARLSWILGLLQGDSPQTKSKYYPMFDFVHLDEKWFYQSKKSHRVYLAEGEKGKYRAGKSSKFIPKVMFTAVVGRPRYNEEGICTFDGKIGIFPFTYKEPAKRKSKNRARGTIVTKTVDSVNQKVTRSMLINQILPAIKAKWPQGGGHKIIFIQQDNAKTHITQQDKEWQQVYCQEDFTFILIQQPPNSPYLNILDLGFFRSIQSLMHKKMPKNVDLMLEAVHEAFFELEPRTLSNVWLSLQYVMNEVLKAKGKNDYDLPHVNKQRLQSIGQLPTEVTAPAWAIQQAWDIVNGSMSLDGDNNAGDNNEGAHVTASQEEEFMDSQAETQSQATQDIEYD